MAWQVWTLLERTGWQYLPCEGGLLDQPAELWEDVLVIAWRKEQVEKMMRKGA